VLTSIEVAKLKKWRKKENQAKC